MLHYESYRNRVVEDMRNLDRMKDEYAGIQIPVAVLKCVTRVTYDVTE